MFVLQYIGTCSSCLLLLQKCFPSSRVYYRSVGKGEGYSENFVRNLGGDNI